MGGVGLGRSSQQKPAISLKQAKIGQRLILTTNRKLHTRCSKNACLSELTTKISMKIDPYHQWQICRTMTAVSGNIRFTQIFAGVPRRRGVKWQFWVMKNVAFKGIQTLRLRHLRNWGQHYYAVSFSPLSPFHWLQNTWPWMTSNGHFTLNFYYYKQRFIEYFCRITD